jgi:hypothetical protein
MMCIRVLNVNIQKKKADHYQINLEKHILLPPTPLSIPQQLPNIFVLPQYLPFNSHFHPSHLLGQLQEIESRIIKGVEKLEKMLKK